MGGSFAFFAYLYRKLVTSSIADVLLFPFVWMLTVTFREGLALNFTWGHLGYALHNNETLLQLASVGGVYLLTLLIVFVNLALAKIVVSLDMKTLSACFKTLAISQYAYILLTVFGISYLYGSSILQATDHTPNTSVAVVHPNITAKESVGVTGFKHYMNYLEQAITNNPDIVVMPENSFTFFVLDEKTMQPLHRGEDSTILKLYAQLLELTTKHPGTSIVVGMHTQKDEVRYNSVVSLRSGEVESIYHKRQLLPFAENSITSLLPDHVEPLGHGQEENTPFTINGQKTTVLICSEVIFPYLVEGSGQLIVSASNDSVFDSQIAAQQNHIMAKLRAVEGHSYLLRSARKGISSIISPKGQVIAKDDFETSGVLFEKIALNLDIYPQK